MQPLLPLPDLIPAYHQILGNNHLVKSPIGWPGGKSRGIKSILPLIPQGITSLCSPFIGGGSIELAAASLLGIKVHAYDAFDQLVKFWQVALDSPEILAAAVNKHYPMSYEHYKILGKRIYELDSKLEIAAAFYALNRASFGGITLAGAGMTSEHQSRFTKEGINRLRNFKIDNFSVDKADFTESIANHPNDFLYLDPPYPVTKSLYAHHKGFDHETLAKMLKARDGWILSYNDCELVRDLYAGYDFEIPVWSYSLMKADRNLNSNELIIKAL